MKPSSIDRLLNADLLRRGFRGHQLQLEGCRIHYLEWSPRENRGKAPIVLVHGLGANSTSWHKLITLIMGAGHPILVPDLPAHGLSTDPEGTHCPELLNRLFAQFLRQVTRHRIILVGNSLGGAIALRYSLNYPETLLGVVALSPAGGFESKEEWDSFRRGLPCGTDADPSDFLRRILPTQPWYFGLVRPLLLRKVLTSLNREGVLQLINETRLEDFAIGEKPVSLAVPLLLVWGGKEALLPQKSLQWFRASLTGNITIEEPIEAGHCPHIDHPHWLARRLIAFADQLVVQ